MFVTLTFAFFGSFRRHGSSQRGDCRDEDWRRENTCGYFASLSECIKWEGSAYCHCKWLPCPTRLWVGWSSTSISGTAGWPNPTYVASFNHACMHAIIFLIPSLQEIWRIIFICYNLPILTSSLVLSIIASIWNWQLSSVSQVVHVIPKPLIVQPCIELKSCRKWEHYKMYLQIT